MNQFGKQVFLACVSLLLAALLGIIALIVVPMVLPQIQPGTEFIVSSVIFVFSLGVVGFAVTLRDLNRLRNDLRDISQVIMLEQRHTGASTATNHLRSDHTIGTDLPKRRTNHEDMIPTALSSSVVDRLHDSQDHDIQPQQSRYFMEDGIASSIQDDPYQHDHSVLNRQDKAPATQQHAFVAPGPSGRAATVRTASDKVAEAYDPDRQETSGTDQLYLHVRPRLDWVCRYIFRIPKLIQTHTLLDLFVATEKGQSFSMLQQAMTRTETTPLLEQSLLYAIMRFDKILEYTQGDLFLTIPSPLLVNASFVFRLSQAIDSLSTDQIPHAWERLKIVIPQFIFENHSSVKRIGALLQLGAKGFRFAVLSDGTIPDDVHLYTSNHVTHFVLDAQNDDMSPKTAHGSKNFSVLMDLLNAYALTMVVISVDEQESLAFYKAFSPLLVEGTSLSQPETYSLIQEKKEFV